MSYEKCQRCNDYSFNHLNCKCKPFDIIDEDGEEHEPVYALDEQDAAVKFAEMANIEGEYYLMNDTVEITVNGSVYRIGAEPDVNYSADKI